MISWLFSCVTDEEFEDETLPPIDPLEIEALPPFPPKPPRPSPEIEPPGELAEAVEPDDAFPFLLSEGVAPLDEVALEPLPVVVPAPPVVVPGVEVPVEVEVADNVEAPPVAVEVAVPDAGPPFAPVAELLFEPAPPAPPVSVIAVVLYAVLDCVRLFDCVLVLLPEFVADDEFGWLVAPCVETGSVVDVTVVGFPLPPELPPGPALAAATEMSAATANAAAIAVLCLNKRSLLSSARSGTVPTQVTG